mgnify:CR=1 FL=1
MRSSMRASSRPCVHLVVGVERLAGGARVAVDVHRLVDHHERSRRGDGSLSLHGTSKPVTFTFTWTPGVQPVLIGKATVRRLAFGIGGGDWADTSLIPDEIAISTKVVLAPAK